MMAVSCLLLFAMVPAYGFFKFALNGEMNLYALFTQFDFDKDLDQREQALKKFYQGVTFHPDTAGEQFVRTRLTGYSRDVYTEFLLHPRLDVQPGLSEKILALLRSLLNDRLSAEMGGLLDDRKGYNRTWLAGKKADVPPVSAGWFDLALSDLGLGRSAQDKSLKLPPCIPDWLYWALSLGTLLILGIRHAATHAMEKRNQLAPMAVLVFLLILVVAFTIWPNPPVFFGLAAVALFFHILSALPRITEEGLSKLRPAIDGQQQPEQQKSQDELDRPGTVNFLSHILWPVKIGLVALAGFIIFTQEEYRPIALAALATILPEISKLLPELHKILGGFKPDKARISVG